MLNWQQFSQKSPDIASAGSRLLSANEVAFIATVDRQQRPRLHPFVPRVVNGHLFAFMMDKSPKFKDLTDHQHYAMHTLPGAEDEEFYIAGKAIVRDKEKSLRDKIPDAMGFATGVDEHHILFELTIDRALHTIWLEFGTTQHRPQYQRWRYQ